MKPAGTSRSSIAARLLGLAAFLVLAILLVRAARSTDVADRLKHARPLPILAGSVLYGLAFAARSVRLNFLLPPEDRLPFGRAWSVSAAATFLLQVLPFRTGEIAGWAILKRVLGASWARAGAVFAMVKIVDSVTLLLVGLAGAGLVTWRSGSPALGIGTGTALAAVSIALVFLPRPGAAVVRALAARLHAGSRVRGVAEEVERGLRIATDRPGAYRGALALAVVFFAAHLGALKLMLLGIDADVSLAGLAFASLTSVMLAGVVPSPAGTFGPMESGFAAGLLLDGIQPTLGAVYGTFVHVVATAVAGLVALPFFLEGGRSGGAERERVE